MDSDTLQKFVENMRAAGQTDEMIAESLISAGNDKIVVLNALGVEHMSQLTGEEDHPEEENSQDSEPHIPSAFTVTDDKGNPIIDEDNMPKAIGDDPEPVVEEEAEEPKHVERPAHHGPRPERVFHPSTQRSVPRSEQPAPAPAPDNVAENSHQSDTEQLHDRHASAQQPQESQKRYEHHTYEDFMKRLTSHKEIEDGEEHTLSEGGAPAPRMHDVIPVAKHDQEPREEAKADDLESVDDLLEKQRVEAEAGPAGTDIDDLIDKKDLDELKKTPDPKKAASEADVAAAMANGKHAKKIEQTGKHANGILNSTGMKVTLILLGVAALIGLAISIGLRISNS